MMIDWRLAVETKLADLLTLKPGWNSYQAAPISPEATQRALALLDAVMLPGTPPPFVVPFSDGGVQLEWHCRGLDVEVGVHCPGERIEVWSEDTRGRWQRDFLMGLDDDPHLLHDILAEMTRRPGN